MLNVLLENTFLDKRKRSCVSLLTVFDGISQCLEIIAHDVV